MDNNITWWKFKGEALKELTPGATYNDVKGDPLKLTTWMIEQLRNAKEKNVRAWLEDTGVRITLYQPLKARMGLYVP